MMQRFLAFGLAFTFSIVVVLGAPAIQKQQQQPAENPVETHHTRIFGKSWIVFVSRFGIV